jgi:hypothetical protein
MAPRERLMILARRAGYSPRTLEHLAEAALPRYLPGDRLGDDSVAEVCRAVEILAQSGMTDHDIPIAVADYKRQWAEQWRERFWSAYLRIARWRFNHPELYGSSPCDLPAPLPPDEEPRREPDADATPASVAPAPCSLEIHPTVAAAPVLRRSAA